MVFLDLLVSIECENLQEVFIRDKEFRWYFMIKCSSCNEAYENEIYFTELEEVEMKGSRGIANFGLTCKACTRTGYITLHKNSQKHISCKDGKGKGSIAVFDCRGLEIISWNPRDQLSSLAEDSSTKFEDMDLSDLPWCDYDEATQNNCQLDAFEVTVERNNKLK